MFSSGVEEEFSIVHERHKKSGKPHLLLYFRAVPENMMADPGPQLEQVIGFRTKIETEKIALFNAYDKTAYWEKLLIKHQFLDRAVYGEEYGTATEKKTVEISPEAVKRIEDLEKEIEQKEKHLKTAQTKLRKQALEFAIKAIGFAREGKFTLSEEMFVKSIELYEEPMALHAYGLFLSQTGGLERAVEKFERMASISKEPKILAVAYGNLGNVYGIRGDLDKAEKIHNMALEINTKLGLKEGMAATYGNLGNVYQTRGDLDKAEKMWTESIKLYEKLGNQVMAKKIQVRIDSLKSKKVD